MIDESRDTVRGPRVRKLTDLEAGDFPNLTRSRALRGKRHLNCSLRATGAAKGIGDGRSAMDRTGVDRKRDSPCKSTKIEVTIEYSRSLFRLVVRDDGRGIDSSRVHADRDRHWECRVCQKERGKPRHAQGF